MKGSLLILGACFFGSLGVLLVPHEGLCQSELSYDDGTAEVGIGWEEANNGVAVRFSVEEPVELVEIRFFIAIAEPGAPLRALVLDANGPAGAPGDTLFGPVEFGWNGSLLSFTGYSLAPPVELSGPDFYVAYIQAVPGVPPHSPTLGLDGSNPFHGRTWELFHGDWFPIEQDEPYGNAMIRAVVIDQTPTESVSWGRLKRVQRVP